MRRKTSTLRPKRQLRVGRIRLRAPGLSVEQGRLLGAEVARQLADIDMSKDSMRTASTGSRGIERICLNTENNRATAPGEAASRIVQALQAALGGSDV